MALALDGSAFNDSWSSSSTGSLSLTTTGGSGAIIVVIFNEDGGSGGPFTANVPTATGLTFNSVTGGSLSQTGDVGQFGTSDDNISVFWAGYTSNFSGTINMSLSGTTDDASAIAFGVSGASTTSPIDADGIYSGKVTTTNGNTDGFSLTMSTAASAAFLALFCGFQASITTFATGTFGSTSASDITASGNPVYNGGASFGSTLLSQYAVVSSAQSGIAAAFGNSSNLGINTVHSLMMGFGVVAGGGAASSQPYSPWPQLGPILAQRTMVGWRKLKDLWLPPKEIWTPHRPKFWKPVYA